MVHPVFDFLDQQEFIRRASLRWKGSPTEDTLNFDAVICGVVALGYFVSRKIDNGIEAAVTSFAKDRLESVALVKPPTVDLIAAWILRAIHLRATSRPHASWMASNVVMHLIEASGIQRDISSVALIYPSLKAQTLIKHNPCTDEKSFGPVEQSTRYFLMSTRVRESSSTRLAVLGLILLSTARQETFFNLQT